MRPYIMSAETQEDMLGWVRALSQSASMEADDMINRWTSNIIFILVHFYGFINTPDCFSSLDAVPVFRTSLRWEIMRKQWSSSTWPRFQKEMPRPQQNWPGCRQNRLYWITRWRELKWRHQNWGEDMGADQGKWSEILHNYDL